MLLLVNGSIYLVWQVVLIHFAPTREFVWNHLALNPGLPGILAEPWQLVTYAFLHLQTGVGGLLHVLFNMLWLVWIGRDLEDLQGPTRMIGLYVLGAAGGALLTVALHAAFPLAPLFAGTVHGASGAVLAIIAAIGLLYPQKRITLLLLGSVRIIHLVAGFLALDILFLAQGGTSVSAHLGGVLTGFAFARLQQRGIDLTGWAGIFLWRSPDPKRPSVMERLEARLAARAGVPQDSGAEPGRKPEHGEHRGGRPVPPAQDVDRILDKISESGYDSLTPEEKKALYEASRH